MFCDAIGQRRDIRTACSRKVGGRFFVVTKDRSRRTDLGTHVTNGSFSCSGKGTRSFTKIFNNSASTTFHGKDSSNFQYHVFCSRPTGQFASQLHADQFWKLQFPWQSSHHITGICPTYTNCNHPKTTCIRGMGIGSNHHSTWKSIVFQDYLVDNSSTWLPKTNAILIRNRGKEIIDLFVFIFCFAQVFICSNFRLDQVIAVNGRRYSNLGTTGLHKLQQGHLCGSILHRYAIRLKIYIGGSSFKSLTSSPFT